MKIKMNKFCQKVAFFCNLKMILLMVSTLETLLFDTSIISDKVATIILVGNLLYMCGLIIYKGKLSNMSLVIVLSWGTLACLSYLIEPSIESIFLKAAYHSVIDVMMPVMLFPMIEDIESFEKSLIPYIYVGLIYSLLQIIVFVNEGIYSMNYSYSTITVALLALVMGINRKDKKYLFIFVIFLTTNMICGARGSLLCCIFAIGMLIVTNKQRTRILSVLLVGGSFIVIFYKNIAALLLQLFPTSRTIKLFAEGNFLHLSQRQYYYGYLLEHLLQEPIKIRGIYSDRIYLAEYFGRSSATEIYGSYAHNIFLEILFQFGGPIGLILILGLLIISYKVFLIISKKSTIIAAKNIYIIYTAYCFGQLLFSSSYLTTFSFGAYIGILILMIRMDKKSRNLINIQ